MPFLFGPGMLRNCEFFDHESGLSQIAQEPGFCGRGPKGDPASGCERAFDGLQTLPAIDPGVSWLQE